MSLPLKKIRERIVPVLHKHGVIRAVIVGSVARGTARNTSDVDIVVEFEGERSLLDLVALKLDLEAVLGRSVDVTTYKGLHPELAEEMLREQVSVL